MGGPQGSGSGFVGKIQRCQKLLGERLNPNTSVQQASQSFGECDPRQSFSTLLTGLSTIHRQKEFSIRQPRSQHAFVAAGDRLSRCR